MMLSIFSVAICISSLVMCLFKFFSHKELDCFLIFEFWECFIYPRYKSFIKYTLCKYFLRLSVVFWFSNSVFQRIEVLNSDEEQFTIFAIMDYAWVSCLWKLCLNQSHEDFLLCFSSRNVIVWFWIWVCNPFELIFVYGGGLDRSSTFWLWISSGSSTICWKD